jgi:hypothetical protein
MSNGYRTPTNQNIKRKSMKELDAELARKRLLALRRAQLAYKKQLASIDKNAAGHLFKRQKK